MVKKVQLEMSLIIPSSNLPLQEWDPEILGKQLQEKEDQLVAISVTLDQRADEFQKIQEKLVGPA